MSHPNTQGNGCSLEDCHTNLFALTDLDGIKWRRLSADSTFFLDPLDDPVLQSFTKCIQADVLCVWRKVQRSSEQRNPVSDQLGCKKELCIFWYGEEPNTLRTLLSPELCEVEHGSWDQGGLPYECRTLLFKALHNLIERCLLGQNFVRVGRWFVQPFDQGSTNTFTNKGAHLSIRFSFFLHGESQVCASIDVRQHTPLRRLQPDHLAWAQSGALPAGVQVVLAPYGLSGMLTGVTYKDMDLTTQHLLEQWRQFYVLKDNVRDGQDPSRIPPAVEVVVAGVRMRYPSNYILVTAETETEMVSRSHGSIPLGTHIGAHITPGMPLTPPSSPLNITYGNDTPMKAAAPPVVDDVNGPPPGGAASLDTISHRVLEKVWQDGCVSGAPQTQRHHNVQPGGDATNNDEAAAIGVWDFSDSTQKSTCNCPKNRGAKGRMGISSGAKSSLPGLNKHTKGGEKSEKSASRHGRPTTPFHRRTAIQEDLLHTDLDLVVPRIPPAFGTFKGPAPPNPTLPQLPKSTFDQSIDSPHSAAPSPLIATTKEPSVSQNGDPTMPTLSPQRPPPPSSETSDMSNMNGESQGNGTPGNSTNGTSAGDSYTKPPSASAPARTDHLPSPYQAKDTVGEASKTETVNNWLDMQKPNDVHGIKRPLLPTKTYKDDEHELLSEALYDFDTLQTWLEHPIKRQKLESKLDLNKSSRDAAALANNNSSSHSSRVARESPPSPAVAHDPYEFSDEASNAGNFPKHSLRTSRDDSFPRASPFGSKQEDTLSRRSSDSNFSLKGEEDSSPALQDAPQSSSGPLLRVIDLLPKINDLDKIFESSDSDNSEPEVSTPPGSNKVSEEPKGGSSKEGRMGAVDIGPTPTDLSRMFPTPPSDNAHNAHSPCTSADMPTDQTIVDHQSAPQTEFTLSAMDVTYLTNIKDWSYVFKPPQQAVIVGSSKYSPIDLPSSRLPVLTVPPELNYKVSWQYPLPHIEKHLLPPPSSHYLNVPSVDAGMGGHKSDRMGTTEAPSPAMFMPTTQRTPMSYELQSPASNASSYLNKNMSSVDNSNTNSHMPQVHSLVVNIMLSDSILNLFKDHNFDSCTICVCNMNIKGADVGVYLTDKTNEAQYRCTCGFSAVMNRKYGANSGLFYEDEVDITSVRDERLEQRKPSLLAPDHTGKDGAGDHGKDSNIPADVNDSIVMLLRSQFSTLFPTATVVHNYYRNRVELSARTPLLNMLEIQDGCEACYSALEAGLRVVENCGSTKLEDPILKATCLHRWPYLQEAAAIPSNSQVVVRLLKSLQPLLQDTIQKKRGTMFWDSVYTVSGPLTWKDFHLLAGRGTDEASEPQPIPSIMVGYEKDWLSLSPYAFSFWDKLLLEPYGRPRDVAYVVVAPDNEFILSQVRSFFKEMSTMYELLKLGRHCPISKVLRDGIMRVGKTAASKVADKQVDEWFTLLGNSPMASKLKLYAQVCRYRLAPHLSTQSLDRTLFEVSSGSSGAKATPKSHPEPSPQPPPSSQDGSQPPTPNSEEKGDTESSTQKESQDPEPEQDNLDGPSIVIYMLDPFTYAADWDHLHLRRLAMLGLLRCYQEMLSNLPEHMHNNIHLQLVPLQSVLDFRETSMSAYLKQLSMSVYTQCRRHLVPSVLGRSLTGFGPAAAAETILRSKDSRIGRMLTPPMFSRPFVLAPQRERQLHLVEVWGESAERAGVMFCAYCLSEDQRWLLAVVTDDRGELLETCTINIEIPNRNRRKKASARKIGLRKLWDFVLGVMSMTVHPWRLVIGRFGRMGHGELTGWAGLLSSKNLRLASQQLRDMCNQCGLLSMSEIPCIMSACLVSMEIHQSIHIMTDSVKVEEKMSSSVPLSTPRDASCTHILVFPTSATAQPNTTPNHQENHIDLDDGMTLDDDDFFKGFPEDEIPELNDLLGLTCPVGSPGSPKNNSAPGSPMVGGGGHNSPTQNHNNMGSANMVSDPQDDPPNLLQQPLAMGFYVSTSPTGPLPRWFWSACPHRENICPTCFKAALHIHCPTVQQSQDEFTHSRHSRNSHPLDSMFTCDVLRYVLETYNALSWLTVDPTTNDRRSCLPAHFMVLMQLYHAIEAFV